MIRNCILCGSEIRECMGFVLARDIEAYYEGRNPNKIIREHCGYCAEWLSLVFGHKTMISYFQSLKDPY
jgi:hypothetical protein